MKKRQPPQGNTIPFSAEDFKYRLDEFLTSGHDDKGQSTRLSFRCPPTLERSLEVLRDSKRFPYSTVSDIVRHAVLRHVEWLHRMEPDIPRHFFSAISAINEVVRDADMISGVQQTFSKLDTMIETYLASGDTLEAQRLISVSKGQLSKLPDSRWKREFSDKFSRKYARHLVPASQSEANPEAARVLEFPGIPTGARENLEPKTPQGDDGYEEEAADEFEN